MNYNEFENKIADFKGRKLLSLDDVLEVIIPIVECGHFIMDMIECDKESSTEIELTKSVMNTAQNIGAELFEKVASRVSPSEIEELGSYIATSNLI